MVVVLLKHTRIQTGGTLPVPVLSGDTERTLRAAMSLPAAAALIMGQQYARIRSQEKETRGGTSVESLHQMRVATRRLRAALKMFRIPPTADAIAPWADDLREIGTVLGAVRDMDVLAASIKRYKQETPGDSGALRALLNAINAERDRCRVQMLEMLDGPLMDRFRSRFPEFLEELEAIPGPSLKKASPRLLKRHLAGVHRAYHANNMTSMELHELRIRCKRLRYACEFFRDIYRDQLDALIKTTTSLQDALGDVHDADVVPQILLSLLGPVEQKQSADDALNDAPVPATAVLRLIVQRQQQRDSQLRQFRDIWEALPDRVRSKPVDDRD